MFEDSQASPACPSNDASYKIKMSVKPLWNDTDKGKPQCSEENLSTCNLVHHKSKKRSVWNRAWPLKTVIHMNYIQKFSSWLTKKTVRVHYKDRKMLVHKNTPCRKTQSLDVTPADKYNYHWP